MAEFRFYTGADRNACLAVFDANCPEYFAPNERADYESFLDELGTGYEVCEADGRIVGAFGLMPDESNEMRLTWIMLDPTAQGGGIGSAIMHRVLSKGRELQSQMIGIAASHKSAPFFAKFGAAAVAHTKDGWGPGMDRIDMELRL